MMNTQFNERNVSMVMDMYELTMSNGYLNKECHNTLAAFDVFYRNNPDNAGFAIFAGLEQVVEYIQNLHFEERISRICAPEICSRKNFWTTCFTLNLRAIFMPCRKGRLCTPMSPS